MPPTRWTLVGRAGDHDLAALDELLSLYRPALLAHLVFGRRIQTQRAEDILHDFVADKIIRKNVIAQAREGKGKFRTYLLTVLDRYSISQLRKDTAKKQRPNQPDADPHDPRFPVADRRRPRTGDVEWARRVIDQALDLTENECKQKGQPSFWGVFELRVVGPMLDGIKAPSFAVIVRKFGFQSPSEASNALLTAKRRFMRNLESVVAQYAGEEGAAAELAKLREILAEAGA
jgi:DNA-directed RNA polymerase specialized sigma24 family protein